MNLMNIRRTTILLSFIIATSSYAEVDPPAQRPRPKLAPRIEGFDCSEQALNEAVASPFRRLDLKAYAKEKREQAHPEERFHRFSIGTASDVRGKFIVTGTDDPQTRSHLVCVIDGERIPENNEAVDEADPENPVAFFCPINESITGIRWLSNDTILASTGNGNLRMFDLNPAMNQITQTEDLAASNSYIRGMAVKPGSSSSIAIGGKDRTLRLLDLNNAKPIRQSLILNDEISSVEWAPFNNNVYVSACTENQGEFYLFDTRTRIERAVVYIGTKKRGLTAQVRFNDFQILVGFLGGELRQYDLRLPREPLHVIQDPYCRSIFDMQYDENTRAIAMSGGGDVSVWIMGFNGEHITPDAPRRIPDGKMKIWSRTDGVTQQKKPQGWQGHGSWYGYRPGEMIVTDNTGTITIYKIDTRHAVDPLEAAPAAAEEVQAEAGH